MSSINVFKDIATYQFQHSASMKKTQDAVKGHVRVNAYNIDILLL